MRPSIVIDSTRFAPPASGMEHCRAPVSTIIDLALFTTFRVPKLAAAPVDRVRGPASRAGTTVANPLHLIEPSGQKASGQLCTGRSLPPAFRLKVEARATAPCGHGTPQLTLPPTSGASPPSQESETVCGAAAAAPVV